MNLPDQAKLDLLKQTAIAADAVVKAHIAGTVPNPSPEQMRAAKAYMTMAVPGFILAMFDEIDRLRASSRISLNLYQIRALLEMADSSGEPEGDALIIVNGDGHSGPGVYAYFTECPEEGAEFIGENEEDQQRGNQLAEQFEASQEIQP